MLNSKPWKSLFIVVLFTASLVWADNPTAPPITYPSDARYVMLHMGGYTGMESYMVDTKTGKTWHLVYGKDASPDWLSIPFICLEKDGTFVQGSDAECLTRLPTGKQQAFFSFCATGYEQGRYRLYLWLGGLPPPPAGLSDVIFENFSDGSLEGFTGLGRQTHKASVGLCGDMNEERLFKA